MLKNYFFITVTIVFIINLSAFNTQAQWQERTSPTTNGLLSISVVNDSVAWTGGELGTILRTTDGGATWTDVSGGSIGTDTVYNIFGIDAQTALCTSTSTVTNIYRTTDGGTTWTQVLSDSGGFMNAIWMTDADNGFAYGDPVSGLWDLYKTTDGGATWNPAPPLAPIGGEIGWNNSIYVSGSDIYFGTNNNKIYYSSDMGDSWTPETSATVVSSYSIWFNNSSNGLAGGAAGLAQTTDGGTIWSSLSVPGSQNVYGITGFDNKWWVARGNSIYYSEDNGSSWTTQYTPSAGNYRHMSLSRTGTTIMAVRGNGGISTYNFVVPVELTSFTASVNSPNQVELSWNTATETNNRIFEVERKTSGGTYTTIGSVEGAGTTTLPHSYSYTDEQVSNGIYTYRLKQIDFGGQSEYSKEVEVNINGLTIFNLAQNFPNPFNPSTDISYTIPESGNVTLAVYNTIGQQVAMLVNGFVTAGSHTVRFNAKALPSGAYFYQLQQGNSVLVKKMMLLE